MKLLNWRQSLTDIISSGNTNNNYMFPHIYMVNREEYNQYKISDRILDIGQINNTDWYKNLSKSSFGIAGKDQMKILNKTVDTIKVVRRLYRTDDPFNPFAALLTIDIDETYFTELLERLKLSKGCASYIINEDGIVIIDNPQEDFSYIHDFMERIRDLIDKLYISEIRKNKVELKTKEAEMEALMAQINPHFLYNSLDSINWLAIRYGIEDISTMVKSLSHIFQYSLNGNSVITFEEEKKQVESYLRLQQTRFKEMLEYYIEFDPEIIDCLTVKLILQPIVENAIVHGFQNSEKPGLICMIGRLLEDDNWTSSTPIKTEYGWLTTFHSVDIDQSRGKNGWENSWKKRYMAGIMLLDLNDSTKVIGMCKEPLLQPEARYEREGFRNDVIFPGGMILEDNGEVKIYYGAADTVECLAMIHLNDLLKLCGIKLK